MRSLPVAIGLRYFASGGRGSLLISFISTLAIAGLILGVGLLVVVLSVMNGFDREMRQHILSVVPHVQLIRANSVGDWQRDRQQIATVAQVSEVTPFNQIQGLIYTPQQTRPIQLLGLSGEAVPEGIDAVLREQNLAIPRAGDLLLSKPIARALNTSLGDRVNLVFPSADNRRAEIRAFRVGGIFFTNTEIDQLLAITSLEQVGQILGIGSAVQGFRVQVENQFNARSVGHRLIDVLPSGYRFRDWFQTHGNLYQAIRLSRNLVGLLIFLIVGIAAFNVISMLMMSVLDKRRDIAVLKTLGLSDGQVLQLFLVQGLLIGLLGISLGVLLGVIGCYWVDDLVTALETLLGSQFLDTAIYPIDYIPVDLRWSDVLLIAVSSLGLTLLATIYPALRASKTAPAEELRYEG
jgi:lipoprotein-releasing system permease protein